MLGVRQELGSRMRLWQVRGELKFLLSLIWNPSEIKKMSFLFFKKKKTKKKKEKRTTKTEPKCRSV